MTIAEDEIFLRLIWSPGEYVNGRFENGAIPSADFRGEGRGCSVDRQHLCQRAYLDALAASQANDSGREVPLLATLSHADVRRIVGAAGAPRLEVREAPTAATGLLPENPAHAEIHATEKNRKSQAQKLRNEVVAKLGPPKKLDEHFGPGPEA